MKTDQYGQVYFSENELFDALYSGAVNSLDNVLIDNNSVAERFNQAKRTNFNPDYFLNTKNQIEVSLEDFDRNNQNQWFMPKDYANDIVEYLYNSAKTEKEKERIEEELLLFEKYNMIDLLRYLKYLVDTMRSNNIVWGVGRGSCVASYCLFLLGVHKINSLKYNIPINEFLK